MSIFRRNLLKIRGGNNMNPNIPSWFNNHIVCWYSPKRQGATNESIAANPRLIDLSGRNRHLPLFNLEYNCIAEDGSLIAQNGTEYGASDWTIKLTDFTLISRYKRMTDYWNGYSAVWSNYTIGDSYLNWTFKLQMRGAKQSVVFGNTNESSYYPTSVDAVVTDAFTTSAQYSTRSGTFKLFGELKKGSASPKEAPLRWLDDTGDYNIQQYDMLLFDQTLTEEQIQWVIDNLIEQ